MHCFIYIYNYIYNYNHNYYNIYNYYYILNVAFIFIIIFFFIQKTSMSVYSAMVVALKSVQTPIEVTSAHVSLDTC